MEEKNKQYLHENPKNPPISIVIPALNEEGFLERALKSLLKQDFKQFELIVVDNGSTDRTAKIAAEFGARVVFEPKKGAGYARQKGFLEAKGEIVATTDADTILPKNWVSRIVKEFKKRKKMVAFGGLFLLYSGTPASKTVISRLAYPAWILDRLFSGGWSIPGVNFSVRKKAFMEVGGFNVGLTLGEDADISQRLKKIGKVILDRKFVVLTSGRRFRNGLFPAMRTYLPNAIVRMTLRKHKFTKLSSERTEVPMIKIKNNQFPSLRLAKDKIIIVKDRLTNGIKNGRKKIKTILNGDDDFY